MHKKKIRGVTYYYTSVRENGKVKTIYLGRTRKEAIRKEAEFKGIEPIPSRTFRISPRPWAYLGLVVLVMVVLFMGNGLVGYLASVSGPTELTGDFQAKLTMHAGTFLPRDAVIEIVFEDQISQLSIEDFLIRSGSDLQPEEGSFYSSEVDVAGYGEGYGVKGTIRIYPSVEFEFRLSAYTESGWISEVFGGSTSFENPYAMGLDDLIQGEYEYSVEIVPGSVMSGNVSLNDSYVSAQITDEILLVDTGYYEETEGYGEEFTGDTTIFIMELLDAGIDMPDLPGTYTVVTKIIYDGAVLEETSSSVTLTPKPPEPEPTEPEPKEPESTEPTEPELNETEECEDNDGDGYDTCKIPVDCDDKNPKIYPGAEKICGNFIDEDCDGYDEPCSLNLSNTIISKNVTYIKKEVENELSKKNQVRVIIKLRNISRESDTEKEITPESKVKNFISAVVSEDDLVDIVSKFTDDDIELMQIDHPVRLVLDDVVNQTGVRMVWALNVTGKNQTICVIDSGIDYSHPNLSGNYIGGYDFVSNDSDPMDDHGHGTYVSGIISGIAPDSRIVAVKVFGDDGLGYESDILAGIDYCVRNKDVYNISVMLMSFGGWIYNTSCYCDSNLVANESNFAVSQGIFSIAASGNDGEPYLKAPACGTNVTSVGAVDKSDNIANFTNIEPLLDLLAPGVEIESTKSGGGYETKNGTSTSAAVVAGIAALVLENETLAPLDLQYRLRSTGFIIPYNGTGYPRVDAYSALINNATNTPKEQEGVQCEGEWGEYEPLLTCSTCSGCNKDYSSCTPTAYQYCTCSGVESSCDACSCSSSCSIASCGAQCEPPSVATCPDDFCTPGNYIWTYDECDSNCECKLADPYDCDDEQYDSYDSDGGSTDYTTAGTCTVGNNVDCEVDVSTECEDGFGTGGGSDSCGSGNVLTEYGRYGQFSCTDDTYDCDNYDGCSGGSGQANYVNWYCTSGKCALYGTYDRDNDQVYCEETDGSCNAQTWFTSLGTGGPACCGNDGTADDWVTYSNDLTTSTTADCRRCLNGGDQGTTSLCGNGYFSSSSTLCTYANKDTATSGYCYYGNMGCTAGSATKGTVSAIRYGNGYFNDGGNTCYYGNIVCSDGSSGHGTSENCPDYCIDDNNGGTCAKTTHTPSGAETCYWTDTCADVTGCSLTSSDSLLQNYCDTCSASGRTAGNYCPPDGTLDDGGNLCWYDGTQSCTTTTCNLGNENCPDYCIDDNNGGTCAKTTHTIGSAETCYWTDTCGTSAGCTLTSNSGLLSDYCDTCAASGRTAGGYCPVAGTLSGTTCYYGTRTCTSTTCNLNTQGGIDYDTNTLTGDVCYWDSNNNHCESSSASETDTPCYAYCYDDDGTDGTCDTSHKTDPDSTAACYYNRGCGTSGCTHSSTSLRDDYCDTCGSGGRNDGGYCPAAGTWTGTTCYYGTHTCTTTACNLDTDTTSCSSGIATCCTDSSTIWESVSCDSGSGPTGTSYNRDTSEARCTSTASGCSAYDWATGGNGDCTGDSCLTGCCGDDSVEDYENCQKDSNVAWSCLTSDETCCDTGTDCVDSGDNTCITAGTVDDVSASSTTDDYAYCNSTGGWEDCDDDYGTCGQTYCGNTSGVKCGEGGGCSSLGEYSDGSTLECCGDDSGENYEYRTAHSSMDNGWATNTTDRACCDANTKCVSGETCYANQTQLDVDGDGDTDFCYAASPGEWWDCNSTDDCPSGYSCIDHDCVLGMNITLIKPDSLNSTTNPTINFSSTVWSSDSDLKNVSLYGNWSGGWHNNQTNSSGINNTYYNFSKNLYDDGDGWYLWTVKACNVGGGCEFADENRTFKIDATPPQFSTYERDPDPPHEDQGVMLNVTITDTGASINTVWIQFTNESGTYNYSVGTYNGDEYYITMQVGNYTAHDSITYRWWATDTFGNENASYERGFTVDNQDPSITVTEPDGSGDDTKTTFTVTWSASDSDDEDTLTISCYGDADDSGYDKTYTCFEGTNNDGTESCDVSGWTDDTYYIWCNASDTYGFTADYSPGELTMDDTPPIPNPAEVKWVNYTSSAAINVTAVAASDAGVGGIEYIFSENTEGSGSTNGTWQSSKYYYDDGLAPNTSYCYTVQYRDSLLNTGTVSSSSCNTTAAEIPSITSVICGALTSDYYCNVTISMGSNPSGTQYYIEETSGNSGGDDYGWTATVDIYNDTGLAIGTEYCYRIKARNAEEHETSYSSEACNYTLHVLVTLDIDPEVVLPSGTVYAYGDIRLNNGTDLANYPFNIWHQGSLLTMSNLTGEGTYTNDLAFTHTTNDDWSEGTYYQTENSSGDVIINDSDVHQENIYSNYGLELLYHMNNDSAYGEDNYTIYDFSGNGNTGSVNGSDWTASGKLNGAFEFNGSDDYVDCGDIDAIDTATEVTFTAWIKLDAAELAGDGNIFTKGTHAQNQPVLIWRDDTVTSGDQSGNTNCLSAFIYDGSNVSWISSTNDTLNDQNWHHIAVTFKANHPTGINIYIDGIHQQSGNTTDVDYVQDNSNPLRIGADDTGGGQPFNGTMDEVAVYSRALGASEIVDIYTKQRGTYITDGKYTSKSLDPGVVVEWDNISWTETYDYGGSDSAANETFLMHFGNYEGRELSMTEESGLVGLWHLNNNDLSDLSGYGNHGTAHKGLDCTDNEGVFDESCDFNGSTYIRVGYNESLNMTDENVVTIGTWVKINNLSDITAGIIDHGTGCWENSPYILRYMESSTNIRFGLGGSNDSGECGTSPEGFYHTQNVGSDALEQDKWYHVVGMANSSHQCIFVNGTYATCDERNYTKVPKITSFGNPVFIGTINDDYYPFNGSLDEVAIWNRGLSAAEILDHYKRGRAADSSSNQNHGQIIGPTPVSGISGNAMDFDSVNDYINIPDSPDLRLGNNQTVGAWIYADANPGTWARIVGKGNTTSDRNYGLWRRINGDILYQIYGQQGTCVVYNGLGPGDPCNIANWTGWHHVVGVYNGTHGWVYIDGVEVSDNVCTTVPNTSSASLQIGTYNSGGNLFNGLIDEVALWNRSLSASEVLDYYIRGQELKFQVRACDDEDCSVTEISADSDTAALFHISGNEGKETENEANIVGLWHLNDNSTTDSSGEGNHGEFQGGLNCTGDEGVFDEGCDMDGSNDYINLSDHDSLNITGDIWISAWVKLNEIESGCCDNIVSRGYTTSPNGEVSLKISVGKYLIGFWNGSSYFANYTVPAGDVGQWVHISGGHNGTGWSLYRNGVLVHSLETSTGAIWVNDSWAIGARSTGSERFLNGSIDEVTIWNRGLSAAEVADLYARGRVADSSSAGADGQIVGPVSIEGMMDNALYFDGSNDYINVASINPTQEITVEAWVKSETSTGYAGVWQIVSKYSAYILGTSGTGSNEMCFIIRNAADWQYGSCYTVPDPENWHHFAGTYNSSSGEKYLYVDGVLKDVSITSGTIVADTGPIHIGHRENQIIGSYHFSGIIDEVAIWNRSLSASEIYQHYLDSNPFMGPDRKSYTYYTNASGHTLDVRNSRYLQYRGYFGTSNGSYTPYLNTVFINYTAVVTDASGDYNYSLSAPASEGTYPVIVNTTYTGLTGSATDNIIVSDYLSDGSSGTWCNSSDKCFFIHDSGGTIKARFDARGYVDVKAGYYPAESSPVPDDNSFIIKDSGGNTMLYINDSGGLVTAGNFYRMITMSPGGGDDFIIKNSSGDIVGYIDGDTGNMNFLGKLNYNSDF